MGFFRWFLGLPAAALVTGLLFVMMAGLIAKDPVIGDAKEMPDITITADIPKPEGTKPIRPKPLPDKTPEIKIEHPDPSERPGGGAIGLEPSDPGPVIIDPTEMSGGGSIKMAPVYPQSCASKGVEGVVVARFDVTPDGSAINIQIVSSPDRCFNSTVIKTIATWRYPPRYENGQAVMQRGLTESFLFRLTD